MDASGVEEVEIADLQIDLNIFDVVFCCILVEGVVCDVVSDFWLPKATMEDGLCRFALNLGVLEAEYSSQLMFKTINLVIDAILSPSDRIEVGTVGGTAVVDPENRRSVTPTIRLISGHDALAGG